MLHTLTGHRGILYCAEFSTDGRYLVTGAGESKSLLWDVETGEILVQYHSFLHSVNIVSFSPDGQYLLTACSDYKNEEKKPIVLWDTFSGKQLFAFDGNHQETITAIDFSPDGKTFLTAGEDHTIRIWSLSDLLETTSVEGFELY